MLGKKQSARLCHSEKFTERYLRLRDSGYGVKRSAVLGGNMGMALEIHFTWLRISGIRTLEVSSKNPASLHLNSVSLETEGLDMEMVMDNPPRTTERWNLITNLLFAGRFNRRCILTPAESRDEQRVPGLPSAFCDWYRKEPSWSHTHHPHRRRDGLSRN